MREAFEFWVKQNDPRFGKADRPFPLLERVPAGYLDLYVQKQWEGFQAGYKEGVKRATVVKTFSSW